MLPTHQRSTKVGRLVRLLARPPGRVMIGVAVLTAVIGVVCVNVPGTFFLAIMMMALWVVRFLFAWIVTRRFPTDKRWLALPVVAVLGTVAMGIANDKHLILRATSPWMERDVKKLMASQNPPTTGWIGPLPVVDVERVGQTLYFEVAGTGFYDSAGYAWTPATPRRLGAAPRSSASVREVVDLGMELLNDSDFLCVRRFAGRSH
jgi:hypothetical protein